MSSLQFQFTLRQMILAMSWLAFGILAWIKQDDFKPASDEHLAVYSAIVFCQIVPFFAAIGALFGHTLRWAVVGSILVALLLLIVLILMHNYGP